MNESEMLKLSVLIVNYNGIEWLVPCLTSLQNQLGEMKHEIIVVDNASHDQSLTLLRELFPEVRLVVNTDNVGFARANNQAFALSRGQYILLLNTDTVFLEGLHEMLAFLAESSARGAVGPAMLDGEQHPRASWGYFPTLGRVWLTMTLLNRLPGLRSRACPLLVRPEHPEFAQPAHAVEWLSGACLLVKREVLETVSFFDSDYFMYGEDVELCYRIRKSGYELMTFPKARIIHYGASGGESGGWKGERAILGSFRGFLHFYRKHRPPWQRFALRMALSIGALVRVIGAGVARSRHDAHIVRRVYIQALWIAMGVKS